MPNQSQHGADPLTYFETLPVDLCIVWYSDLKETTGIAALAYAAPGRYNLRPRAAERPLQLLTLTWRRADKS